MSLIHRYSKIKFISERKLLELFPPFFFMGVKVLEVSEDYRRARLQLPLRWYGKNMHGTMFGGFILAVSDPVPVLLVERILPGIQTWTKANTVEFMKPARSALDVTIEITDQDIETIQKNLRESGSTHHTFEFEFRDARNRLIAQAKNTIYLRKGSS